MVLDLAQVAQGRGKRVLLKSDYREIFIHSTGEYSQYKYLFYSTGCITENFMYRWCGVVNKVWAPYMGLGAYYFSTEWRNCFHSNLSVDVMMCCDVPELG